MWEWTRQHIVLGAALVLAERISPWMRRCDHPVGVWLIVGLLLGVVAARIVGAL